jgi:hypothetical protein
MHFEPRPSSIAAAIVYGAAAVLSAASLWFVVSGAFRLDDTNRNAVLSDMRTALVVWVLLCGFGITFATLALRFARLSIPLRRVVLFASCGVALIAGAWLEWWQSLYFLFPAVVLALAFREVVHA